MLKKALMILCLAALPLSVQAKSSEEKRQEILKMRDGVLEKLYESNKETKSMIAEAEGYAVFNSGGVNLILLSAGSGTGVAHDNKSGENIFMKMATGGVGIGLGVKDYRTVMIFHKRSAFEQFVDKGWDFSGQADAAATVDEKGAQASGADTVVSGVSVYQMTKTGLALQATLQGTKYWQNDKLNKK
ncbi:YSC84-related protein [Emcibacter sp.]|uniref:lipid-binding SYLF domain-containing protein n=1 Tax=Emcibacter sp. TaxID=1979954 RepID=UPI002AA6FF6C|nr:YSC84-related protein [Emcibacter sp.]